MKIEALSILLILSGSLIISILFYLKRVTDSALKTFSELININQANNYELNGFLTQAVLFLEKTRTIEDCSYKITFLNNEMERKKTSPNEGLRKSSIRDGYGIDIEIIPKGFRGEKKYVPVLLLEVLFLLIEIDVLMKIRIINETFYNVSRLQTYILHDAKNISQLVLALSYNLKGLQTREEEERFIRYLKETLPAVSLRASKIVNALEVAKDKKDERGDKQQIDLRAMMKDLASLYRLNCKITGDMLLYAEEQKLTTVFDNLFKNISDKRNDEGDNNCSVVIGEEEGMIKITLSDTGAGIEEIGRVFEPFYTTKKGSMGVGLSLVKNIIDSMGGVITARNNAPGVEFNILLPQKIQYVK